MKSRIRKLLFGRLILTLASLLGLTQVVVGQWVTVVLGGREGPGLPHRRCARILAVDHALDDLGQDLGGLGREHARARYSLRCGNGRDFFTDIIHDILGKDGLKFTEHQVRSVFPGDDNLYAGQGFCFRSVYAQNACTGMRRTQNFPVQHTWQFHVVSEHRSARYFFKSVQAFLAPAYNSLFLFNR